MGTLQACQLALFERPGCQRLIGFGADLGAFFDQAKKSTWWDNTLFILVADHGSILPGWLTNFEPKRFKIPMIWLGGALAQPGTVIHTIGTQTDISLKLLHQLGELHTGYKFSRDLLGNGSPFAFYCFNDGLGFLLDAQKDFGIWDNAGQHVLMSSGDDAKEMLRKGKAYLQVLSADFGKR